MASAAILLLTSSVASGAIATDTPPPNLLGIPLEQLIEIEITTAAKIPEPLVKTAATVSIITDEELRRMGARSIYDALAQIPGLVVGGGNFTDNFIAVRGIRSTWSEKVLLLLDGHLLNDARSGSATFQFLDSLPVENIVRIEVVRGPGSALYGANAFLGVINVITRSPQDISGAEVSVSGEVEPAGTVARRYNLLTGGTLASNWQGSLNLNVLNAPGAELPVAEDAFGHRGTADNHEKRMDLQGSLSNGPFTLRARYLRRQAGDGFGGLSALNTDSNQQVKYALLDAAYHAHPAQTLDLTVRAYVDQQVTDNYYVVPAGSIPPTSSFFPWNTTGLIGDFLAKETISGSEVQIDYRGVKSHTLTTGLAWRNEKLHDVRLLANYDPTPLLQVTDVSSYFNWIEPANRDIASVYMQDLWDIRPHLRGTLGARYDHYSDFGGAFNPRLGLSWQLSSSLSTRLSYGKAFRAPSFFEQYVKNNPAQQGNPDLTPEKVDTWEAGTYWQQGQAQAGFTLFQSNLHNLIDIPSGSTQFQNLGSAKVRGLELEGRYRFSSGLDVNVNYGFANPDFTAIEPSTRVAKHNASLDFEAPMPERMHWHINTHWRSGVQRNNGDARHALDSALVVNTALTKQQGPWDFTAAIYNLTDTEYAVAAPMGTLPGDYTAAGRSFLLQVRYDLE